ncbi:hypothetical protein H7F51_13175 [Novosphingobium flavum]|uniref:Uncharacterized protein n=1 Tax=Novosphingobium flavum TaxID=1778672 RepID=A0A7X1FTA3_9SPHN|nr:hypothetical protein [Novosphingobium flavum]MBC2666474.1 hypothetical protein [Novosphingobium flavum]
MNPLSDLIAPVLALLPVMAGGADSVVADPLANGEVALTRPAEESATGPEVESFSGLVRAMREADTARQVRIEQRLIIRIAPGPPPRDLRDPRDPRRNMLSEPPPRAAPRMAERKMNQCVQVGGIAGVQPDGPSRLMLFMRDQRIVSASLEKTCNARDFYSGFLVERSTDGMICAGRDRLLSRSGSNCALGKFRQLVGAVDDDE